MIFILSLIELGQQQPAGLGMNINLGRTGQTGLGTGQTGLGIGQTSLGTGQTGLGAGQTGLGAGQTGLGAGQTGLGIGQTGLSTGGIQMPQLGATQVQVCVFTCYNVFL